MDTAKPEEETGRGRKRADHVIGDAGGNIGVVGIGMIVQEDLCIRIGFLEMLQGIVVFLEQHAVRIGLHPGTKHQSIEPLRIARLSLQAPRGKSAGAPDRILECLDASGVGRAGDAAEETLVIEKVIAREHALEKKLFEEVAGGDGDLAKRLVGMLGGPFLKDFTGFGKLLLIKQTVTLLKFGNRTKGRARGMGRETGAKKEEGREDEWKMANIAHRNHLASKKAWQESGFP